MWQFCKKWKKELNIRINIYALKAGNIWLRESGERRKALIIRSDIVTNGGSQWHIIVES